MRAGALSAVRLRDGVEQWTTIPDPQPSMESHRGLSAAVSVVPGVVFAPGLDVLRRQRAPLCRVALINAPGKDRRMPAVVGPTERSVLRSRLESAGCCSVRYPVQTQSPRHGSRAAAPSPPALPGSCHRPSTHAVRLRVGTSCTVTGGERPPFGVLEVEAVSREYDLIADWFPLIEAGPSASRKRSRSPLRRLYVVEPPERVGSSVTM
jgi:hypothetical protein